jgi:hypothetical protein
VNRTTQTASASIAVNLFEASLSITDFNSPGSPMFVRPYLLVMELPASLGAIDVLIGMDILLECQMLVHGPLRTFSLEF